VPLTWLSPMMVLAFERVFAIVPSGILRHIVSCLLGWLTRTVAAL